MKSLKLFTEGLALSAAPALSVASYALAKNLGVDGLLFLAPFLMLLPLIGFATSYFSLRRLSLAMEKETMNASMSVTVFLYIMYICFSIGIIYAAFIHYEIQFAYFLLPVVIAFSGALSLLFIIRVLGLKKQLSARVTILLVMLAVVILMSLIAAH